MLTIYEKTGVNLTPVVPYPFFIRANRFYEKIGLGVFYKNDPTEDEARLIDDAGVKEVPFIAISFTRGEKEKAVAKFSYPDSSVAPTEVDLSELHDKLAIFYSASTTTGTSAVSNLTDDDVFMTNVHYAFNVYSDFRELLYSPKQKVEK